jgi:CheY-like chemotaxis protein
MNSPSSVTSAKPRLILCVDDGEVALRMRKLVLCSEGYDVLTATSGEKALDLFKHNLVELVISDHFLSDKSGTEIAREMKELKPEVPILIVSAALESPDGIEFTDGFLAKGQPPDVLLDTIAHLLAK